MSGKKKSNGAGDLRRKAEEKVSRLPGSEELSIEKVRSLVHELRVHQVELEMQNDALREAQRELIDSNERYTDLYDFAPVGYLTVDERSIILQANLTLTRQLETERGSLIGLPFPRFITPDEKRAFRDHLGRIFENHGRGTFETKLIARGSGGTFPALLELMFVEDSRGMKQCRISVTDTSEIRGAEEAAKGYLKKLEQSNKELQEFAFVASHDLQEPLRKVQAFGNLLMDQHDGALDEQGKDYLRRMVKAVKRMSAMIDSLLTYSRVATRAEEFRRVDLGRVAQEVVNDISLAIENSGGRVEVGELPEIEADNIQMHQLFQNLIMNALKFHGDEPPRVRIWARARLRL